MPSAPPKWCPRCRIGHPHGVKCPIQKAYRAEQDLKARASARKRGYTTTWDKFRVHILRAEPFCRMCLGKGKMSPATLVDHIIPLVAGGALLDPDNVQPLDAACHAIKTAEDIRKYPEAYGRGAGR